MSNYLAIATVTATMQRILQASVQLDVPGARVTTARPDASGSSTPEIGVNIYLYQATPNPAWRNSDLRNRRPKGDLIKQAQAGLDLYYLFTFYGNEVELEPQRLLGSTVRTLVDQPTLTAEMIRETVRHPNFEFLQESTLADQVERVTIVPSFLSTDDLSKIWSVFFQTPYMLSFACQGGAVLIEGEKPSGRGLPIRSRQFYSTPSRPVIDRIFSEDGSNQAIVADKQFIIQGKQLAAEVTIERLRAEQLHTEQVRNRTQPDLPPSSVLRRGEPKVQIGAAKVTPQSIRDNEIRLQISQLSDEERQKLRAGVQSLQVIYPLVRRLSDVEVNGTPSDVEQTVASNTVAFVLYPTIENVYTNTILRDGEQVVTAEITVDVDVVVGTEQRVFLLLNQHRVEKPSAYIFTAQRRTNETQSVRFTIRDIQAGDYLVRLQVDNAESLLETDGEQYVSPSLEIR